MSFNKKFIDEKLIKQCLEQGLDFSKLFKGDALIFLDDTSSKVYYWFVEGLTNEEIKLKLYKNG
jgi:hypothetical protein